MTTKEGPASLGQYQMMMRELSNDITNEQFLKTIFAGDTPRCHVTDFPYDPTNIPQGKQLIAWKGDYYNRYQFTEGTNQYFCISTFEADEQQQARRRKNRYRQTHCVVLDDVREKLSEEAAQRLPQPSWILETSKDSFQWGYILDTPCTEASLIDNLNDGLISSDLAPSGKDPGQRGITRLVRCPEGINNKASKLVNGEPWKCRLTLWEPSNRVTLEQLAAPFSIDLDAPRKDSRIDGAGNVPDHPLVNIPDIIHIKEVRSVGRFDITCPWVDEHTGEDDSGSAVFTNSDGSIGFKCHHGSCDSRTGADLLSYIEAQESGFNERLKTWQVMRDFPTSDSTPVKPSDSPLSKLLNACANGESQNMKSQMLADKFILKDLAILGQSTVIFAAPNSGKTLLTLWMICEAIESGEIEPSDLFYANCDDTYKGGVEKLQIAEKHGFNMLLPGVHGFKANDLLTIMAGLTETGEAKGKIVVFDTLKKVLTDLLDKRLASQFGNTAREFVSSGGSIISLSHTNKHKIDGKSIYSGTSDVRDDADCTWTIEHEGKQEDFCSTTHTVTFENTKARGNVTDKVSFKYTRDQGGNYDSLFSSVKRISKDEVNHVKQEGQIDQQQSKDAELIEAIKTAVTNGVTSTKGIEDFTAAQFNAPRRQINRVLSEYEDRLWTRTKGLHNKSMFNLLDAPALPNVSFL